MFVVLVSSDLHVIFRGFGLWGGLYVSFLADIYMDFHFAAGAPRYQNPCGTLGFRQVSGKHHARVVWCLKMSDFVSFGWLFV